MIDKFIQESTNMQQKNTIIKNFEPASKAEENLKTYQVEGNDSKIKSTEDLVVYYRGENMRKVSAKHVNLQAIDQKAPQDTSFHIVPHDHINYRYECIRSLGRGTFGNVVLAIDHKVGIECAVKVVASDIRFTAQARQEIAILELLQKLNTNPKHLQDRFPIVKLIGHFMFNAHMCLSFELLGCSLYDLIKDKKDQGLPRDRVRRLMASVLDGLTYVWNAGIIHCDLKPENILLISREADGGPDEIRDYVKIIDFGSSCFVGKRCYPYIQSRFYRAPEVIMRLDYGQPIDIWSFGCLVFEMIRGYPLFPGEDELDQLGCMMEKLGMPPWSMVGPSRVFTRYFTKPEGTRRYYNPLDKQTPLQFIPRYCTIYQNADGNAELRPNLSKKTRRLRKPPGAVPVAQALISTLSYSSGKYNNYTPTPSEELDNIHLMKLIDACLSWVPESRINPNHAKTFSWFNYKINKSRPLSIHSVSHRSSNPPPVSRINSIDCSQCLPQMDALPAVKIPATLVKNAASIISAPAPPKVPVNRPTAKPGNSQDVKAKVSVTSILRRKSESIKKHASPASISSGENKPDENAIYTGAHKQQNLKTAYNELNPLRQQPSNSSLVSLGASIDDSNSRMLDNSHYTRKDRMQGNERHLEPSTRLRKRNQSVEPKRHTQPVENESMTKRNALPSRNFVASRTVALNSSPENDSQKSGRHNPNCLTMTSQWDLSSTNNRVKKMPNLDVRSNAARARQQIISELTTLDKRSGMLKTQSAVDLPINSLQHNLDDSDKSTSKQVVDNSIQPKKQSDISESLQEIQMPESSAKLSLQQSKEFQFPKQPNSRCYGIRDTSGKVLQPHADNRRRRLPYNTSSTGHLNDLEGKTIRFSDLSNVQTIFVKIKPQN